MSIDRALKAIVEILEGRFLYVNWDKLHDVKSMLKAERNIRDILKGKKRICRECKELKKEINRLEITVSQQHKTIKKLGRSLLSKTKEKGRQ